MNTNKTSNNDDRWLVLAGSERLDQATSIIGKFNDVAILSTLKISGTILIDKLPHSLEIELGMAKIPCRKERKFYAS